MIRTVDRVRTMSQHSVLVRLMGMSLLCGATVSCADTSQELTQEQRDRVATMGAEAATALMRGLGSQLVQAIETGGPAHAVTFCSSEAQRLTDSIARDLGADLRLKRTTFRFRNPANAPDSLEADALEYFEDGLPNSPSSYVQRVSATEVRYYQPLFVADLCLQCHGQTDQITPEVAALLAEEYPADAATGYSTGDFRGLIRVSLPTVAVTDRRD